LKKYYLRLKFYTKWYFDRTILFVQKHYYRLLGKDIVHFLHLGKTGGTSLKYALDNNYVTDNYFIKGHLHHVYLKHIPKGEKFFFSIRDPKDRFISAFFARQREDKPRFYLPWRKGEARAFGEFNTPNELALALSSHNHDKKQRAVEAMKSIIHLKDSYWDWFHNEAFLLERLPDLLQVCHLKTLDSDFKQLKHTLGISDRANLPERGVASHSSSNTLDKKLDPEAITNLKNWYAEDYKLMALLEDHDLINRFE